MVRSHGRTLMNQEIQGYLKVKRLQRLRSSIGEGQSRANIPKLSSINDTNTSNFVVNKKSRNF